MGKILPEGIFLREKDSVSITTNQSWLYILGHRQPLASVLRDHNDGDIKKIIIIIGGKKKHV